MVLLGKKNAMVSHKSFLGGWGGGGRGRSWSYWGGGGGKLPAPDRTVMGVSKSNRICRATILYNTCKSREEFTAWSVLNTKNNIPRIGSRK